MSTWTELGSGMRLPHVESLTWQPLTDAQKAHARLTVCDRATDLEDAAMLLDALGLLEDWDE